MSQRGVERALGKMVTDNRFRDDFFRDPVAATINAGLDLTAAEVDALLRVPKRALSSFSGVPIEDQYVTVEVGVDPDPSGQSPEDLLTGPLCEPLPGGFRVPQDLKAPENRLREKVGISDHDYLAGTGDHRQP